MKRHFFYLFLGLGIAVASPAYGALTSSFDIGAGFSVLKIKAAGGTAGFETNLTSISSVEANYVLKHTALSSAYTMSFFNIYEGVGVSLPMSRFSVGGRYYPLGLNGSRLILDQGVIAQVWKATPFIGLSFGITNLTVGESEERSFNASLIEFTPRFGAELPLTPKILLTGQLAFNAGSALSASDTRRVSYEGITGTFGIIILDADF